MLGCVVNLCFNAILPNPPTLSLSNRVHKTVLYISAGLGKQTLGGHKQNLVCTRTQEKGAVTPQETDPDLAVSVQEPPAEAGVSSGLAAGLEALSAAVPAWDLLKEVSIIFIVHLSHPYLTTGKNIALTRRTFGGRVMSLLFNMLSRLVIAFLPRSKRLLIS